MKFCPICQRRLPAPGHPDYDRDVVYSSWTKTHYCAGRRFTRCRQIAATIARRNERRNRAAA